MSELNIIRTCQHPNIVRYFSMQMDSFLSIDFILEYVDGGTLKEAYRDKNEELLIFWAYQILKAFVYLEEQRIVHRDIKPSNILVHQSGIVKVSDFGNAKFLYLFNNKSELVGTPAFIPPELLVNRYMHAYLSEYTYKSDIWSLGLTLYDLAHGHNPFPQALTRQDYFKCVLNNRIQCDPAKCSQGFQSLLGCMLRRNPNNRKSAAELIVHEVFKEREVQLQEDYQRCL